MPSTWASPLPARMWPPYYAERACTCSVASRGVRAPPWSLQGNPGTSTAVEGKIHCFKVFERACLLACLSDCLPAGRF